MIVNSTAKVLDFNKGQVSKMIADRAGKKLIESCKENYPVGIEFGMVAFTDSFDLKYPGNVKKIFHAALDFFDCKTLKEVITIRDYTRLWLYTFHESILNFIIKQQSMYTFKSNILSITIRIKTLTQVVHNSIAQCTCRSA